MAWIAIAAVLGLALLGLWALSDIVRDRADARAESGEGTARGRRSRIVLLAVIGLVGVLLIGTVVFLVGIDLQGANDTGSSDSAAPTSTTIPVGARTAREVRVAIVNASGFPKPAVDTANALRVMGYTITGTTSTRIRQGIAVQCQTDRAMDAAWLAHTLGETIVVEPFPDATAAPPPPDADCIVVVGQQA